MHEVLAQFLNYLRAIWRRRWYIIVTAWIIAIGGWIAVYMMPNRYEASARVYVDTQSLLKPLLAGLTVQPNADQQVLMMTRTLISRPNLEKVARMTDLDLRAKTPEQMDSLISHLSKSIELLGAGRENLYTISYEDRDPAVAKKVVQALLTLFVESNLGNTRQDIASSQKFIDDQLKAYEDKLSAAENALKDFKQRHLGMMPGQDGDYFSQLSQARDQLSQAQLELREAQTRRDSLKAQLTGNEPTLLTDDTVSAGAPSEIDTRIQNLQQKLDNLRLNYTEQYPDIIAIKRIIAQLEEQKKQDAKLKKPAAMAGLGQNPYYQQLSMSLAQAEADVASLGARAAEYQARYNQLKASADRIPVVEEEYTQLMRNYDVYKKNYDTLLARRESAILSGDVETKTNAVDFRVIDPPRVPLTPSSPNRPLLSSLVLLGAIAAGIALAFLVSQIRPTIDDRRTLREFTGLPLLGSITLLESPEDKKRKRKSLMAYVLSFLALLGAYGAIVAWQIFLLRAA